MISVLRNQSQSFAVRLAGLFVAAAILLAGLMPALHGHVHAGHGARGDVAIGGGEIRGAAEAAASRVSRSCGHGCSGHAEAAPPGAAEREHGSGGDRPPTDDGQDCGVCLQLMLVKSGLAMLGFSVHAPSLERAGSLGGERAPAKIAARPSRIFRERGPPVTL